MVHGLYWLLSRLELGECVLAVDDIHWADPLSLRFLELVVNRAREDGILVLLALRTGESSERDELISRIASHPDAESIRTAPLSVEAVGELVASRLGNADGVLAETCHHAAAGNPLLVTQLIDEVARTGAEGHEATDAARDAGPRVVGRWASNRLVSLGPEAQAVARAAAILGDDSRPADVMSLSGVDKEEAAAILDDLARIQLIARGQRVSFVHPIVARAIYEDIGPRERSALHREAARLIEGLADTEAVAAHLLACDPAGETATVNALEKAARTALGRGASRSAAVYLERALAEPPADSERIALLRGLGEAEILAGIPTGPDRLEEVLGEESAPEQRLRDVITLSSGLLMNGRPDKALEHLETTGADLAKTKPELAAPLAIHQGTIEAMGIETTASARRRFAAVSADEVPEDAALTIAAFEAVFAGYDGAPASDVGERAVAVLERGLTSVLGVDSPGPTMALWAAVAAGRSEDALAEIDRALGSQREAGSQLGVAFYLHWRAHALQALGRLEEAESDAREALELCLSGGHAMGMLSTLAYLCDTLTLRGKSDEALGLIGSLGLSGDLPPVIPTMPLLLARGHARLAAGDTVAALADFDVARERKKALGDVGIAFHCLGPGRALALRALGAEEDARAEARHALGLARDFGTATRIGDALRAAAACTASIAERIALLEEAVTVLERGAPNELAAALIDLGAALRRQKRRVDARNPLTRGLDLAARSGALGEAARAETELKSTGARPRRAVLSGVDSLTPSERRVAELAAAGRSNPEIAQLLFVSRATVESHLHSTYRKLDIPSRAGLAEVLHSKNH